jgi:hypothetical protein
MQIPVGDELRGRRGKEMIVQTKVVVAGQSRVRADHCPAIAIFTEKLFDVSDSDNDDM